MRLRQSHAIRAISIDRGEVAASVVSTGLARRNGTHVASMIEVGLRETDFRFLLFFWATATASIVKWMIGICFWISTRITETLFDQRASCQQLDSESDKEMQPPFVTLAGDHTIRWSCVNFRYCAEYSLTGKRFVALFENLILLGFMMGKRREKWRNLVWRDNPNGNVRLTGQRNAWGYSGSNAFTSCA